MTLITVSAVADGPVSGNQTVDLNVTGSGIEATDYNLSGTQIQILNGQTQGSVTFTVLNDSFDENQETATPHLESFVRHRHRYASRNVTQ
ncbi:MAG: hypothetical protein R3C05_27560 [Pirellulaceae bacterium]